MSNNKQNTVKKATLYRNVFYLRKHSVLSFAYILQLLY